MNDPQTVQEALELNKEEWQKAMDSEWSALVKKNVFELTDLPPGKKAIKSRWVFKLKVNAEGKVERYRARLVAKGFSQMYGIDYTETFSPVVSYPALRLLIALAARLELKINHLDVTAAFLNGELTEEIYMKQPEGFVKPGMENKVWLLKKAIYGLKQASKAWYDKCKSTLKDLGFKSLPTEPCIYVKGSNTSLCVLAVYVDDILVFYRDDQIMTEFVKELEKCFDIRDLGEARSVLGMRLRKTLQGYELDQEEYIKSILNRFHMLNCATAPTPMEVGLDLRPGNKKNLPDVPYQMLIGSLMYAMVCTRPDIAFPVGRLSRLNNCYTMEHWNYAKRVLRYLKGTLGYKIKFTKTGGGLEAFADADFAGDKVDRVSCTGFVVTLGGGPIAWESRKQNCVALSTTEAEYISLASCAKKTVTLSKIINGVLGEKGVKCLGTDIVPIFNDNQAAIKNSTCGDIKEKSKHIDVKYHYVKEQVRTGEISVRFKPTNEMVADFLTKSLCNVKFMNCVRGLCLN
jgi:hypothetical protein